MRRKISALLLCLAISLPASAMAQSKNEPSGVIPPEVAAAAESVMRLFTSLIGAIPTYEAPELMPNGDIIIRRKQRQSEHPEPNAPENPKSTVPQDDMTPTRI